MRGGHPTEVRAGGQEESEGGAPYRGQGRGARRRVRGGWLYRGQGRR